MTDKPQERISLAEARYLALAAQRLEGAGGGSKSKPGQAEILDVIRAAGCLQLDSISVVSRAHETAVWSRVGCYAIPDLEALHYPQKRLIEYWAHAASLLPVEFFPYLRRAMARLGDPAHHVGRWAIENRQLIEHVLARIERDGPLSTRGFERPAEMVRQPWDWWGGKPAKQALDYLWTLGELVVLRRERFERVYELTDRAFPGVRAEPLPPLDDEVRFFTQRALNALGVGTLPWIADFFRCGNRRYVEAPATRSCLSELVGEGLAIPATIEGIDQPAWLDVKFLPALTEFRSGQVKPGAKTLLTPFDNLLWGRARALALFGFDYRLESYTPGHLRTYGYHTLPILIEGRLIGRLDARHRRKERTLIVESLHLEPGTRLRQGVSSKIAVALRGFARFLGCDEIQVGRADPPAIAPLLQRALG